MNCNTTRDPDVLAREVIAYSRRVVTLQMPILLGAVYALRERKRELPGPISTDGVHLWYHPEQILADFRTNRDRVAEQILHVTLHCLLGHLNVRESYPDRELFDALADCKTAMFAAELGGRLGGGWGFSVPCAVECGPSALPALHRSFTSRRRMRRDMIREVSRSDIRIDDHRLWHPATLVLQEGEGVNVSGEGKPDWEQIRSDFCRQAGAVEQWGHLPGRLKADFRPAQDSGISYTQFLQRFAAPKERVCIDPDSIDARWYHLGLEQYGDIPLLEPCEMSEAMAGDELVIALDTSGSCSGEICSRFLRETCSLLRDISAGSACFRVLLLQCDTQIEKEVLVCTADDLERLPETFVPEGFGGTDFRPVFQRVEQLREDGTLSRVRGLIYLSDGYGEFPAQQPDYPVAFLLADEDGRPACDLPDWVMALELDEQDFTLREVS